MPPEAPKRPYKRRWTCPAHPEASRSGERPLCGLLLRLLRGPQGGSGSVRAGAKNEERKDGRKCVMSTNIHPRLCDAPTAPCDSAGHRKGSSQNTAVAAASNKSWSAAQSSPWTDWCYRLNDPARAQANVQVHAETGERRKPISHGRKHRTQKRQKTGPSCPVFCR